ncbi:hypothetical protein DY000_02023999 [Brassica cretica]|uniref:Uncharacterized protein n=1 Tax=Brassica cretica TaxID=69181 RepID=A0ABQ7E9E4_BRACR|nr:hypothetical protein DY000_02023999 [Brassica cretica]
MIAFMALSLRGAETSDLKINDAPAIENCLATSKNSQVEGLVRSTTAVTVDLDWFGDLHVKFWLILIENRRKQTKPTEAAKLTHVLASEATQIVVEPILNL